MFDGIKVFCATKQKEREALGEVATAWLDAHEGQLTICDKIITQSSDHAFHCLTITLFYRRIGPMAAKVEP